MRVFVLIIPPCAPSQFFISTLKEAPSEAELVSHKLMLRAGLIRRLGSGLYTWMPLGLRVLRKVEAIVREEMNRAGAIELLMPAVQPAELWQETGRWEVFGPQMLKIKDRHERDFCFGPTHEEVITDIARREIKQLPAIAGQLLPDPDQVPRRDPPAFRRHARARVPDEGRLFLPRRARDSLEQTYRTMYDTYTRIFTRLGLEVPRRGGRHRRHRRLAARTNSTCWPIPAKTRSPICPDSGLRRQRRAGRSARPCHAACQRAAKRCARSPRRGRRPARTSPRCSASRSQRTVKLIAVMAARASCVVLLLRGDHRLNEVKAGKLPGMADFRLATEDEIRAALRLPARLPRAGRARPRQDPRHRRPHRRRDERFRRAAPTSRSSTSPGSISGATCPNRMLVADIRNVVAGDPSPGRQGHARNCAAASRSAISSSSAPSIPQAMNATFLDEARQGAGHGDGLLRHRRVAHRRRRHRAEPRRRAASSGRSAMAPFLLVIVPIGYGKSEVVCNCRRTAVCRACTAAGIEVLLDDRDERPGVMFADMRTDRHPAPHHRGRARAEGRHGGIPAAPRRAGAERRSTKSRARRCKKFFDRIAGTLT